VVRFLERRRAELDVEELVLVEEVVQAVRFQDVCVRVEEGQLPARRRRRGREERGRTGQRLDFARLGELCRNGLRASAHAAKMQGKGEQRRTVLPLDRLAHALPVVGLHALHLVHRVGRRERRAAQARHDGELVADKRLDAGVRRLGDRVHVVAALERNEHLAAGERRQHVRHVGVAVGRDEHLAELVALCGVEAGRDCGRAREGSVSDDGPQARAGEKRDAPRTKSGANSKAIGMTMRWKA